MAGGLAELSIDRRTGPFGAELAIPYLPVNGRMLPVLGAFYMAMPDWIRPAIGDAFLEVVAVADRMLPEPPLPDPTLALRPFAGATRRALSEHVGEACLDLAPTHGKVRIPVGQGPDHVHVIWQDDRCVNPKRPLRFRLGHRPTQKLETLQKER